MLTDTQIVDLYWQRNEQAITESRDKYGSYCNKVAYSILGDPQDAEECEHDTYLTAWNTIPPERPMLLRAFLAKITRNLSISLLRKRQAQKRGGGEVMLSLQELEGCIPAGRSFEEELDARQLAEYLNRFLLALPEDERNVFVCRYWRCDDIASIAKQFSFSEGKVKMMLLRTRNKLRHFLEKEGIFV